MKCSLRDAKNAIIEEALDMWNGVRYQRCTIGFAFAILFVLIVIVGNVILLISLNFWLTVFPTDDLEHNSSQIAIQVVTSMLMVIFFGVVAIVFGLVFGGSSMWHALTDTNRMGHPAYRLFLLFASGASNGLCGVTGVYSMSHTPEFIQSVLLCCIPFSAQAWTVIFIPEERKRNYLSLFFIASFLLFVAGILLSSMSAFLQQSAHAEKAPWDWTLVYLLSSVLFGLWCVVQRLYLDAMILRDGEGPNDEANEIEENDAGARRPSHGGLLGHFEKKRPHPNPTGTGSDHEAAANELGSDRPRAREERENGSSGSSVRVSGKPHGQSVYSDNGEDDEGQRGMGTESDEDGDGASVHSQLLAEKRSWGRQSVNDNAAKLVLLLGGLFFQLLVSFVVFPVDAIPWFGTSSTVGEAWEGFANSFAFIFRSWFNIRYGLLNTLGYIMSFVGCTFLNEHSPTLASVVLQLAGPITSLVIIIIPQWNVYQDSGNIGHKVGGVILLLAAAFLYHVWEQRSLKEMMKRAHAREARAVRGEPSDSSDDDSDDDGEEEEGEGGQAHHVDVHSHASATGEAVADAKDPHKQRATAHGVVDPNEPAFP